MVMNRRYWKPFPSFPPRCPRNPLQNIGLPWRTGPRQEQTEAGGPDLLLVAALRPLLGGSFRLVLGDEAVILLVRQIRQIHAQNLEAAAPMARCGTTRRWFRVIWVSLHEPFRWPLSKFKVATITSVIVRLKTGWWSIKSQLNTRTPGFL